MLWIGMNGEFACPGYVAHDQKNPMYVWTRVEPESRKRQWTVLKWFHMLQI